MKKVFLMLGLVMMTGFVSVNGNPQKNDVQMYCVGTCMGTFCNDGFANEELAIKFIDAAENFCDVVNEVAIL